MPVKNLKVSLSEGQITIDDGEGYVKVAPPDGADWNIDDKSSGVYCKGDDIELPKILKMAGRNHRLYISDGAKVRGRIEMSKGNGGIAYIGKNARISIHLEMRGGAGIFAIGEGSTCEGGVFFVHQRGAKIIIGDDCLLATGIVCRTYDGHSIYDRTTKEQIALAADISIGAHVWLTNGVRVAKGATIGDGCIIGQLSLVTGTTEPNSIYAGTPARLKKSNIVWSRDFSYEGIPERFR